jgi:hypothetical protein
VPFCFASGSKSHSSSGQNGVWIQSVQYDVDAFRAAVGPQVAATTIMAIMRSRSIFLEFMWADCSPSQRDPNNGYCATIKPGNNKYMNGPHWVNGGTALVRVINAVPHDDLNVDQANDVYAGSDALFNIASAAPFNIDLQTIVQSSFDCQFSTFDNTEDLNDATPPWQVRYYAKKACATQAASSNGTAHASHQHTQTSECCTSEWKQNLMPCAARRFLGAIRGPPIMAMARRYERAALLGVQLILE